MKGYIDGVDFYNLPVMKYWNFPNSWDIEKKKTTVNQRIFSGEWYGAQKRDGAFYLFCKDMEGNMFLRGRSKSVSGEYLDKIDWVPQLRGFFQSLPLGTCFIGELYLESNEQAKSTTSIMNCLVDKAIKRQEKEPLKYYIFDVLANKGESLLNFKAIDRFLTIHDYSETYFDNCVEWAHYYCGQELWNNLQSLLADGYEGVVITREEATYQPGKRPSKDTLKVKKELQETIDCVVMGANPPSKVYTGKEIEDWTYWYDELNNEKITKDAYLDKYKMNVYMAYADGAPLIPVTKNWFNGWAGSLRLGVYKDGKLEEIGNLSGITDEIKENWKEYVGKVCTITAMEIMDTGGVRHPKFCTWRDDINPSDCTWDKIYG